MEKNIKNIRAEFKKNGIYYTTTELAETLKKYVDYKPTRIYDPTCGQGNLLSVFDASIEKYGQEIYADELEKASKSLENFHGYCGDTLKEDGFKDIKFDLIVANPPFSISWSPDEKDERFVYAPCVPTASRADYAFILHILYHLADTGKAICLEFPGILYRGQREGKIRKWLIEKNYIERVVSIPPNTFVDTTISTCIVVFNKSKTTTDIVFESRELNEEKTISVDEVIKNYFNLSINLYVFKEEPKVNVNPIFLEDEARKGFIKRFENELSFEKQVCEMEKISIKPFLDELKRVIEKYERTSKYSD